jgi:hypothetical protein
MSDNSSTMLSKGADLSPFANITDALFGTKTMDESLRLVGDMIFTNLTKENIEVSNCF